jgi:Fe-S oxidoreductase
MGVSSKEVYLRVFSCAGCGYCSDVCPREIDPLRLHEAIKIELLEHGEKPPESMNFIVPGQRMNLYEIIAPIQTKPSEARWLKRMPPQPEKAENVAFLGCFPKALPHNIFAFLDVLERMGISSVTLGGGELCCGGLANMTNPPVGQSLGQILVEETIKTGADYIANTCPFCALAFYPYLRRYSFKVKGIADKINQ